MPPKFEWRGIHIFPSSPSLHISSLLASPRARLTLRKPSCSVVVSVVSVACYLRCRLLADRLAPAELRPLSLAATGRPSRRPSMQTLPSVRLQEEEEPSNIDVHQLLILLAIMDHILRLLFTRAKREPSIEATRQGFPQLIARQLQLRFLGSLKTFPQRIWPSLGAADRTIGGERLLMRTGGRSRLY